jgi:hypothetical protein
LNIGKAVDKIQGNDRKDWKWRKRKPNAMPNGLKNLNVCGKPFFSGNLPMQKN